MLFHFILSQNKIMGGASACNALLSLSSTSRWARQVVTPLDPRIHCALVCGAKSCPPIKVYTAEALEEGLEAAAAAFCESAGPATG